MKLQKTEHQVKPCAGKNCSNIGIIRLKLKYINRVGFFCRPCASQLLAIHVAVEADDIDSNLNEVHYLKGKFKKD